jgi:hypothetical protein
MAVSVLYEGDKVFAGTATYFEDTGVFINVLAYSFVNI